AGGRSVISVCSMICDWSALVTHDASRFTRISAPTSDRLLWRDALADSRRKMQLPRESLSQTKWSPDRLGLARTIDWRPRESQRRRRATRRQSQSSPGTESPAELTKAHSRAAHLTPCGCRFHVFGVTRRTPSLHKDRWTR